MHSIALRECRSFDDPHSHRGAGSKADDVFQGEALAMWMETEGRARILVDDDLRARWVSPRAAAMMSRANSLLIRNGHIRTRENRFDRQLRDFVAGATSTISLRCFHDPSACEHLVLTALRLGAPFEDIVGLTMQPASASYSFRIADLHDAFGFTLTEGRVAYDLLCGNTAEQTAQILHVGLETVRTHIKRIYVKLGVSSREAFFHRLAPFMLVG
jgi:DNA-binding CsgD family transcriptional regulator